MGFTEYLSELSSNYFLLITSILTLLVVLINGWTDAPNAIATCVSTRAISPKKAIAMAAVFNFLGVLLMSLINNKVAFTIANMVDFGGDATYALAALCAAMVSIVLWATLAWVFGIPTSESHALIAGISGAAIALQGGLSGINGSEWMKVVYGLLISTFLGFGFGYGLVKLIEIIFKKFDRRKTTKFFRKGQIFGGAGMAFVHGAQDGQKFIGVFLLGAFLSKGVSDIGEFSIPLWLMVLCSAVMALGTSIGGYRIIKTVGMDMVKLEEYQGFATDVAASSCILFSTLFGIPVSTTHVKSTAIMGVGAARKLSGVRWDIVRDMVLTWILTFPGCGIIGFFMAKLFIAII
ncbi:MAG: inorganic phosphate transporter [Bacilli bacterium]|nr:inorganic phosphate transporter [Bacilli bacterium]